MVFLDDTRFASYSSGTCMVEKNDTEPKYRTAWHPLLVFLIETFAPANRKVFPEFNLNRLPQRVDIIIIELQDVPAEPARKLRSIFDHLRKHTLIEYKGVTDELEWQDAATFLGYACQYIAMRDVAELEDMALMVVADRISDPFVEYVYRLGGSFEPIGHGLWQGKLAGMLLHGVELDEAYKSGSSERLFYTFTRDALKNGEGIKHIEDVDKEDVLMYHHLCKHIVQLRKDPVLMNLKDMDVASMTLNEVYRWIMERTPVEERLQGLTPEQVLQNFTPEQLVAALPPAAVALVLEKNKH